VFLFASLRDYLGTLVHPAVRHDPRSAAQHRVFIGSRLLGGLLACAALPIFLTIRGVPSAAEVAVFAWFIAPMLLAGYLSLTGSLESAHTMSSLTAAAFVTIIAAQTGGVYSLATVWLVILPLEAVLSGTRRLIFVSAACAIVALLVLAALPLFGWHDQAREALFGQPTYAAFAVASAVIFAAMLALAAESSLRLRGHEAAQFAFDHALCARYGADAMIRFGANGIVHFASPSANVLFSRPVTELLGQGLFETVHVADRPLYLKAIGDAQALGQRTSAEIRIRRFTALGGPQFVWVDMRCVPVADAFSAHQAGEHLAGREVLASLRDIDERKTRDIAREFERAETQRAHAAKSQFLAMMSHELRTPLNVIIGFSEMLMQEEVLGIDPARRLEYSHLINEAGHHLLSVVNGVLDMSKIDSGTLEIAPESVDLTEEVKTCCDLLLLKAGEAGVTLAMEMADNLPAVQADRRALKQVMLNLLSNAIRFTDRNGRIGVSARHDGRWIVIAVQDTGIGIAEDDLGRLGEPFFQAGGAYDRRHDGTGLGLSIVKGLVELHGGDVRFESQLGKGTRITLRLPADGQPIPLLRPQLSSPRTETGLKTDDASNKEFKKTA
jgi:cell cycle sensor histidine kinase DivJ